MDTMSGQLEIVTDHERSPNRQSFNETKIFNVGTNPAESDSAQWQLSTELPVSFSIKYSNDILNPLNPDLLEYGSLGEQARRLVILDSTIEKLYGDQVRNYFSTNCIVTKFISINSTESTKNLETLLEILESMEQFGLMRRNEPVIAIGGGVLLDIAGMAASMYRRGVPYIRVPTTLLGLVDASVGAKVAVNHFERRNRLGAYYPPVAAYLDRTFLTSLDKGEISNGLAEILKMAIIKDAELFELIDQNAESLIGERFQRGDVPVEIINRSIQGMVDELEPNLWEKNLERLVDFGHSFSPLIEVSALPELSHGQAVILDILLSCIISSQRGFLNANQVTRIFRTVKRCGLPTYHPMFADPEMLKVALADTVKHRNGDQNLPLPIAIGRSTFINNLTDAEIVRAAEAMGKMASVI